MVTRYGNMMDLEAKFIIERDVTIDVFIVNVGKAVIPKVEEQLGEWKKAKAGDMINIRLTSQFIDRNKLLNFDIPGTGKLPLGGING